MDPRRTIWLGARLVGAALLVATGAIHLDLYLTGYWSIPTIGGLFVVQVLVAFALAIAIGATTSWVAAAAGAAFAASTLLGYLLSVAVDLFGFTEVRTTAGLVAGVLDVGAVAACSIAAILGREVTRPGRRRLGGVVRDRRVAIGIAVTASTVSVALLLAASALAAGPPSLSHGGMARLAARDLGGTSVLTGAHGLTLYWFGPDTPTSSACIGSCTAYWPPVTGSPALAAGVSGTTGTIARRGDVLQATYDGHPLYSYVGDLAPGEASGNGLDLNGGIWHEVVVAP